MADSRQSSGNKRLGSYPHTSVVASIATALFMIGFFFLFVLHAEKLISLIQENVEVQIYLKKEVTQQDRDRIKQVLAASPFVGVNASGPAIRFLSRDEAASAMIKESGENFVSFLGENPLRDAFIINIRPEYYQTERLKQLKTEVEAIPGVFEVTYVESLIGDINRNIQKVGSFIAIFVVILLITVVLLIHNAIKLALFSQRFLIRSMQLVGATPAFIKRPFIIRAAMQGLSGGIIASVLLGCLLMYVNYQVNELRLLQDFASICLLFVLLLLAGAAVCVTSAYSAVNRYLHLSLDELY